MVWLHKSFNELSLQQLYDVLQLRQAVFCVEQNCPYNDLDGLDQISDHIMVYTANKDKLLAYARIVPPNINNTYASIGRIITAEEIRGQGVGKQLLEKSIAYLRQHLGRQPIHLSAQCYLIEYYRSFGFEPVGDMYLEDDIPHIAMLRI